MMQESSKKVYKCGACVEDFNNEHWEFVRNLTKIEIEEKGYTNSINIRSVYRCKTCNTTIDKLKQEFKRTISICPNGCNGVLHHSRATLKGVNDIATTHPHLIKYLTDKKDGYIYSAKSFKKVNIRCLNCGSTKFKQVSEFVRYGVCCDKCSDGISYPEKFLGNLLCVVGVDYKKEISFDSGGTRYDFYIPSLNMIIETHGKQHYTGSFETVGGRTLEEEQENDKYKMNLALTNGIKHYVVIDARVSNLEWLKNSILNSNLYTILKLDEKEIDWNDIAKMCETSLVREVCKYFDRYGGTPTTLGKVFSLSSSTIGNYLKRGTKLGWCNYNGEKQRRDFINSINPSIHFKQKRTKGVNIVTSEVVEFKSSVEASRWLNEQGITNNKKASSKISECARGGRQSAYGYIWSYIDDVEETDNETQSN